MTDDQREGDLTPVGASLQSLFPQLLRGDFAPAQEATETPGRPPKTAKGQKPNTKKNALAEAAAEIVERPDRAEASYLARELVQCTLPHRDPGDVPAWVRRNGNFALVLQPGFDAKSLQAVGLPFGEWPRLLLLWIVTEAIQNKSRYIKLGGTLNEFLRQVGGNPNSGRGKRGDAKRMREQLRRLFHCRISFQYAEGSEQKGSESLLNMEIVREAQLWWDFKERDQASLFEGELILGEAFYAAIISNPVPIDWRAVLALKRGLKQSSFAIDVYTWATYRVFRLQRDGVKEVRIPLKSLQEQFGAEYSRLDNFKAAFSEALANVQQVFPALDYSFEKSVLVLRNGKGKPALPTREERPFLPRQRAQNMARQISPKARQWFAENYPEWDIETAIQDFNAWREKQGIESANNDAHFRSFVKKWAT